eukprot:s2421_g5.t1
MPKGQSVRDDLDAAVVGHRHVDVHVCQADMTGDTRTGFLAHPRSSAFKREGPGGEHSGSCAGSPVIAEWVKATPAQQRVQEGGPGRRALRKLRRQPCDRRVGQGDHGRRTYAGRPAVASGAGAAATRGTMAKSPSIQPRQRVLRRLPSATRGHRTAMLLRDDLPFGPDDFARHADPGMFDDLGLAHEQPRVWAPRHGPPQGPRNGSNLVQVSGKARRKRMSLRGGDSPSTLAVPPTGKERRLATKVRAAAKEIKTDQREVKAEMLGPREEAGAARARAPARSLTKVAASELQRPPSSQARTRTTSLHRADWGYPRSVDYKLCATPKCKAVGNDLDAALILPGDVDIEIKKTDVESNGGSSLTADAGGNAHDRGHAARRSPKGSCSCRQRQRAEVKGRDRRSQRRNNTRKSSELRDSSGETGLVVKTRAA